MDFWPFGVSSYPSYHRRRNSPSIYSGFPYGGVGRPYSIFQDDDPIPSAYHGLSPYQNDLFDTGLFGWPTSGVKQQPRTRRAARSPSPRQNMHQNNQSPVMKKTCDHCDDYSKPEDHDVMSDPNKDNHVEVSPTDRHDNHQTATDDSQNKEIEQEEEEEKSHEPVMEAEELQRRLQAIESINEKVESLRGDVESFNDVQGSKRHLYLSETLVTYLLQLDRILADGINDIRTARKQVVLKIERYLMDLEGRLSSPAVSESRVESQQCVTAVDNNEASDKIDQEEKKQLTDHVDPVADDMEPTNNDNELNIVNETIYPDQTNDANKLDYDVNDGNTTNIVSMETELDVSNLDNPE